MRDFFTTQRWSPGHVVGTGILVFGTLGIAEMLIGRARAQSAATNATAIAQARGARWGAAR